MREFKLKAFVKSMNLIAEVDFIDFELGIVRLETEKMKGSNWCYQDEFNFDEVELIQYTGLLDKQGVEIYTGDIIYIAGIGLVEVEFPFCDLYDNIEDIEYIKGNIYENKELLI